MDLVSIFRALWRHKLATIPVILFTCLGVFYIVVVKPPVYQASASFALVYPPAAPTGAEIAADPKLAKINPNNPLLGYDDPSTVTQIVINLVNTPASQQALEKAGSGNQYTIAASAASDYIVDITGEGTTPQAAVHSAYVVTQATKHTLHQLQANQGVSPAYMIKSYQLQSPSQSAQKLSGKLRDVVAVLGLGTLVLFIVISIAQAIGTRRTEPPTTNGTAVRSSAKARPLDQLEPVDGLGRFRSQSR